jgi:hypothetical protein
MKGTVTVRAAAAQGGGEEAPSGDTSGSAADTGSATTTDDTPSAAAGAATLPSTGLDGGGLLALGVITLALGVLLHRRAARTG